MLYTVINKSVCSQYDFGEFLFSPEFFMEDKLASWNALAERSSHPVTHYFSSVNDRVDEIDSPSICYDLTDGLPKFFDAGAEIDSIKSTKKLAVCGDFAVSRLCSYLEEMGLVEFKEKDQLFSTEFLIFRERTHEISAHTLFALCMTDVVQTIFKRGQYGTVHPRFYDFILEKLPIPDCLLSIDKTVRKTIESSLQFRAASRDKYKESKSILLSELGLLNWRPKHQLAFIKNYSDAERSERIDAEYFQPKYDEIANAIKSYEGGWGALMDLTDQKEKNFMPKQDVEYKYIELANIGASGEVTNCTVGIGQDLPTRARRKVTTGDVIVSSVEGSLSSIAMIEAEYDQALCSTGFHVIDSVELNPETFLVFLKSTPGQLQLKKGCGGTILTAINSDEFKKIILPKVHRDTQTKIQQQVQESFTLRKQSKRLLKCAKRAVEMAIEKDEKTAIKWLETKTGDLLNQ